MLFENGGSDGESKQLVAKVAARSTARQDQALRQAEERLQCVIELSSDFYWEQDAEHRFTVYGPRSEGGDGLAQIVGKASWELCDGPVAEGCSWDRHRAALEARQPFKDLVHRFGTAESGVRYVSFSGQPSSIRRKRSRAIAGSGKT